MRMAVNSRLSAQDRIKRTTATPAQIAADCRTPFRRARVMLGMSVNHELPSRWVGPLET